MASVSSTNLNREIVRYFLAMISAVVEASVSPENKITVLPTAWQALHTADAPEI